MPNSIAIKFLRGEGGENIIYYTLGEACWAPSNGSSKISFWSWDLGDIILQQNSPFLLVF